MKYPVTYLTACSRTDVPSQTKVFNKKDVPYYLWVEISHDIASEFSIYEMHEVTAKCNREVTTDPKRGIVKPQGSRPWIRITTAGLSTSIGLHIYKLSFVNRFTEDVVDRYFGYIIQCDNPCKPYDYMEGRCKCYGCINCDPCKQAFPIKQTQRSDLCDNE